MIDMEPVHSNQRTTKCSLAIRLIDAFNGKAPNTAGLQLIIDNVIQKPIVKPDGFIIYTNIPEGEYTCSIQSSYYLHIIQTIHANDQEPMITLSLQPNASYPFGNNATYLRLAIKDKSGEPINGASIHAVCSSESNAKAILTQDIKIGDKNIVLTHMKGKIVEGDFFLISNRGNDTHHDEYCCISKEIDGFRSFVLNEPVQSAYPRGTLFLAAVRTHSSGKGEAVIPFRNPPSKSFVVQVTIEWKDFIMVREVDVKEADTNYIIVNNLDLGEALI
jgi:hypothetical protein